MFTKKPHIDVKKSVQKILDLKKDPFSRLKHLKQCLELREFEAKTFFEANYSQIYFIFFETISNLDTTFKQKGQKQSKEEQDVCLFIFEKILIYLPEILNKGWQQHSIGFLLQRLLHHQNSITIRVEGLRLFLIWYQVLNTNAKQNVHHMFAGLVPGVVADIPNPFIANSQLPQLNSLTAAAANNIPIPLIPNELIDPHQRLKLANLNEAGGPPVVPVVALPNPHSLSQLPNQPVYNYNNVPGNIFVSNNPVIAAEIEPMIPSFSIEPQPKDYTIFYLQHLLNFMVNQVAKVQWTDNRKLKHRQCFRFLFEQFNQIYLRQIFAELDQFSFYEPQLVLPSPRIISLEEKLNFNNKRFQYSSTMLDCKARVIMWFAKYMKSNQIDLVKREKTFDKTTNGSFLKQGSGLDFMAAHEAGFGMAKNSNNLNSQLVDPTPNELDLVYSFLTSTRSNVNLVHQILNQAFLMPFWQAETMREVVGVYREWIYKNYQQVPVFLSEPTGDPPAQSAVGSQPNPHNEDVRAGLSPFHRIFITYSANVFLLKGTPLKKTFLDEQVEMCKRVLNVYRYMVMKVEMDRRTWEQLLLVVLRVTSLVLTEHLPMKKEDTLGGRLAPAFFETLIVTWIKANLNIFVSMELWERFQSTLKSLTAWEELVKEWSRTMDTLTRVMSRYVYNINLYDLPLEKPINRKNKRQISRGKTVGQVNFNPKVNEGEAPVARSNGNANAGMVTGYQATNDGSNLTTNHHQEFNESTRPTRSTAEEQPSRTVSSQSAQRRPLYMSQSAQTSEDKEFSEERRLSEDKQSSSADNDRMIFHKSFSDSNLIRIRQEESAKLKVNDDFKSYMENFAGLERDCNLELGADDLHRFAANHQSSSYKLMQQRLRSKSLINISTFNILPHLDAEIHSLNQSRSPSPISCTATHLETNNSLKESPLNFDGISIATNHSASIQPLHQSGGHSTGAHQDANRSVITGGTYRNWSPDSAVILWRRMLGILGDINEFKNPHLHTLAVHCLAKIVDDFIKICDNLGILIDPSGNIQQNLDFHPTLVPPLDHFVAWLFEATQLGDEYKQGKLIAYRLLCIIATKRHESLMENGSEFLPMFYHALHNGLNSCDLEVISVIIKFCKARLFSFSLPGSSSLLYDFTEAAKLIINSNEIKDVPRYESLSLLSTLIGMNEIYQQLNALNPAEVSPCLTNNRNHYNFILDLLIKAAKKEQTALGRSMALNALGIYLYQQLALSKDNLDAHFLTIINVLIGCTKFPNRILSRNACDLIRLQCDFTDFILKRYPKIVAIIVEGLISSIRYHVDIAEKQNSFKEYQNLLLSLMICLCEWCLAVPKDYLKLTQSASIPTESILYSVLKLLNDLSSYNFNSGVNASYYAQQNSFIFKKCFEEDTEIDYTIEVDNLVENATLKRNSNSRFDAQKPNLEFNPIGNGTGNKQSTVDDLAVIWMASSMLLNHLLNFVGNFPLAKLGPSRLSCCVNEYDDNPHLIKSADQNDLGVELFNAPNIIFFIVNNSSIISFVDLTDNQTPPSSQQTASKPKSFLNEKGKLRVILRDLSGKFSWTCSNVHSINRGSNSSGLQSMEKNFETNHLSSNLNDDDLNQDDEQRLDPLDILIQNLNETSPECLSFANNGSQQNSLTVAGGGKQHRRSSSNLSDGPIEQDEENMMALLVNQHYQEMNYAEKLSESQSTMNLNKRSALQYQAKIERCFEVNGIPTEFLNCRQFIEEIGILNWEKRSQIELLAKNERVLRELRNLDKQKCRETHKIAVIYVKEGQEDKQSILANQAGSKEFEQFVSGLGWEVDLSKHLGFRGGLEDNLSTGKTAPYYANSFYEVIFHVSTRMPSTSADGDSSTNNDCMNKKLRHLGNDEVHIVWSEHYRNYRRGIIATEFCDVLIVIYPIVAYPGYYRVTISRKNEIPFFGPLYSEAVVHLSILSGLVRATAINASRAQRSQVPMYRHFFEERNQCLQNIFRQHKELTSFETFANTIYTPKLQEFTGNNFFNNSILSQPSPNVSQASPADPRENISNSTSSTILNLSKNSGRSVQSGGVAQHVPASGGSKVALNVQQEMNRKQQFEQPQPLIRSEHLERPNLKLVHQNSEPLIRTNNKRSASVSVINSGSNNHRDILHFKHHPMMEK